MTRRSSVAALAIALGLVTGCGHRVHSAPPPAPGRAMWGFSSAVQDDDAFCVPAADGGIACVTVAEVRWFVQNMRRAQ